MAEMRWIHPQGDTFPALNVSDLVKGMGNNQSVSGGLPFILIGIEEDETDMSEWADGVPGFECGTWAKGSMRQPGIGERTSLLHPGDMG